MTKRLQTVLSRLQNDDPILAKFVALLQRGTTRTECRETFDMTNTTFHRWIRALKSDYKLNVKTTRQDGENIYSVA